MMKTLEEALNYISKLEAENNDSVVIRPKNADGTYAESPVNVPKIAK
jgi:hypothetical protein